MRIRFWGINSSLISHLSAGGQGLYLRNLKQGNQYFVDSGVDK